MQYTEGIETRGGKRYRHFRWSAQRAAEQELRMGLAVSGEALLPWITVGKTVLSCRRKKPQLKNSAGLERLVLHQIIYQKGNMTEIKAK